MPRIFKFRKLAHPNDSWWKCWTHSKTIMSNLKFVGSENRSKNTQKHEKPRKLFNRFRIIFHSIFDPTKIYSSFFANNFPCLFLIRENYDWALPKINPPQNISAQFSFLFLFVSSWKIIKLSFLKCLFSLFFLKLSFCLL